MLGHWSVGYDPRKAVAVHESRTLVLWFRCAHADLQHDLRSLFLRHTNQRIDGRTEPSGSGPHYLAVLFAVLPAAPLLSLQALQRPWMSHRVFREDCQHWGWDPQLDIHQERDVAKEVAQIWDGTQVWDRRARLNHEGVAG